jgi:hypothetical protein
MADEKHLAVCIEDRRPDAERHAAPEAGGAEIEAGCQAKNRIRQGSEPLSGILYHALAAEVTLRRRTGLSRKE